MAKNNNGMRIGQQPPAQPANGFGQEMQTYLNGMGDQTVEQITAVANDETVSIVKRFAAARILGDWQAISAARGYVPSVASPTA